MLDLSSKTYITNFVEKHFLQLDYSWMMYNLHIIGDRYQVLSVAMGGTDIGSTDWHVEAHEGPNPAVDGSSHSHQPIVWKQMLIFTFMTFQCYIRIVCNKSNCAELFTHYSFESAAQQSLYLQMYPEKHFLVQYPSTLCNSKNNNYQSVVYCSFFLTTSHPDYRIELLLEEAKFAGPGLSWQYKWRAYLSSSWCYNAGWPQAQAV